MQEITVEMILETVRKELNELEEKYRQSKSPKKEWEIVAYQVRDKNVYYPEYTDDIGRIWGNAEWKGAFIDSADVNHPDVKIFSVRRLSDGEVFSVGDRIKSHSLPIARIVIDKGWTGGIRLECPHENEARGIKDAEKLPQPILTTADGVEIYSWGNFKPAVVFDDFSIRIDAYEDYWMTAKTKYPDAKLFSTRQAAEEYILNSRPLLSLSDVKEAWASDRSFVGTDWLLEKLTALVKQKLNQ